MLTEKSKKMIIKSFQKTIYRYDETPEVVTKDSFGVYLHVPFCFSKCAFCPFYKEIYNEKQKVQYVSAIIKEIENSGLKGEASWLYIGGGTPNTLAIQDLKQIINKIHENITVSTMGIELLPTILDEKYIEGLNEIGFTKISIGVESLSEIILSESGRKIAKKEEIRRIIEKSHGFGIWVNIDLMIGLPGQYPDSFIYDIEQVSLLNPDQITIYPFMEIGKLAVKPGLDEDEQFSLIEQANRIMLKYGYERKGIWIFAKGDEVYDSSRDELIEDYFGFGPAAFSTFGNWKVVNPELDIYLENMENDVRKALIASKDKASDDWRKCARMLYDLRGNIESDVSRFIKFFVKILKIFGYIKSNKLTKKGIMFTHKITKTVVETLPYPLQNTQYIKNYQEYLEQKDRRKM